jgi:drug/metabolite transporter (DMT)-like permease
VFSVPSVVILCLLRHPEHEDLPLNRASAWAALFAGLLLVSTAAPFILLTRMDPFALVLLRMGIAAPLFLAAGAARGGTGLPRAHLGRVALGGALLAAHFLLWIKAFDLTSYASNLLLLIAQPVVAALLGHRVGERPTRETWIAIALAVAGLAAIAGGDLSLGTRAVVGDLCSILAGVAISLFYVETRAARAALPVATFMGWTMLFGAAAAVPAVLVAGAPLVPRAAALPVLGWTPSPWLWLAGLVVVTTMGGHGLMNAAARGLRLFTVNIVIVLEPPLGILLGMAILGQAPPTAVQVAGGAVLAAAVVVALLPDARAGRPGAGPPPAVVPG